MSRPLRLADIVFSSASRFPEKVALSYRARQVTYGDLARRVVQLSNVLSARGIRRGDRVCWWAGISLDAPVLYYAIAELGAVFVPINPGFNAAEAGAVLDVAEPVLLVTDNEHRGDVELDTLLGEHATGSTRWETAAETDPDVIFFTSGTTGTPKGVVLSQRANYLRTALGTSGPRVTMSIFPQYHWGGWSFIHNALFSGGHYVLEDAGDTEALLRAIERYRVEKFYALPAIWKRILAGGYREHDLSSLQCADTGTSATPPDLLAEIAAALPGTTTQIGYGATEAGGICSLSGADIWRKPGSVGLPMPGMETRLVDGELWVRSPQAFSGYYKSAELTAEAVVDGWYRTGDVVERDAEGYLSVIGRIKEQIRTAGEFVAPPEVDVVIQRHPAVADAAVAGVPDADWGEIVTAFVVLRPGAALDLPALRRHCEGSLASFKLPRALHIVEEIPRTASTGKPLRKLLVEEATRERRPAQSGV